MLLIPFVENSFKHGAIRNGLLEVDIRVETLQGSLRFEISNTSQKRKVDTLGIGLENIQKRLKLLYKDKYNLEIRNEEDLFVVKLEVKLQNSKAL